MQSGKTTQSRRERPKPTMNIYITVTLCSVIRPTESWTHQHLQSLNFTLPRYFFLPHIVTIVAATDTVYNNNERECWLSSVLNFPRTESLKRETSFEWHLSLMQRRLIVFFLKVQTKYEEKLCERRRQHETCWSVCRGNRAENFLILKNKGVKWVYLYCGCCSKSLSAYVFFLWRPRSRKC